jgi:integrative and conjugative element protein (TIGR02256 family)
MGYWSDDRAVITAGIGPGPNAIHRAKSFVPDQLFQEEAIAECYRRSNRVEAYLGDWHSHLSGKGHPSSIDVGTMIRVARSSEARAKRPLMAIITPKPEAAVRVWILTKLPLPDLPAIVSEAAVRLYTKAYTFGC